MKSWRITFRCNPYRAMRHYLWVVAPDGTSEKDIKQAAYRYKDGLPVDVIDEVVSFDFIHDEPEVTLTPFPNQQT